MNPFTTSAVAERYARGRPYHHCEAVRRAKARLSLDAPLPLALDVGCGTGLSSMALKEIAREVVGADISLPMLSNALSDDRIRYVAADAEALPFPDGSFHLLAITQAIHWLDLVLFFAEAKRVLRPPAFLLVFDHGCTGEMVENVAVSDWAQNVHIQRYPTPPRKSTFSPTEPLPEGLQLCFDERYEETLPFTQSQLAGYLITQSNTIAVVESGRETWDEVHDWLMNETAPYFQTEDNAADSTRHLHFTGRIIGLHFSL